MLEIKLLTLTLTLMLLFMFIHMFIYAFIHLHINILKPSHCLNSIQRQVFCINFSRRIQISELKSHARLFICLLMMSFFLYLFIHTYIHLQINILRPSRCLNSILRQVFCINFSRRIQIS